MKNTLLIALLVASLGLNLWFALARTGSRSASTDAAASTGAANAAAKLSADRKTAEPAHPFIWKTSGTSETEMRSLVADLRAAGFPPGVIAKIVRATLRDRVYAKVAEMPFWQLNAYTREMRKAQLEADRELQRQLQELLGAAGSQLATLDPTHRRDRFGDLPDEKVAALLQIDRDYQDVAADLVPSGVITPEESRAMREQFKTLERERQADVKAALGAEAYAEYERQNSGNAMTVLRGLRELQVTEEEYNALFAAQKARNPEDTNVMISSLPDPTTMAATYAFNDQVRAVLGDERAHTFLKSADSNYRRIAQFGDQQSLPPATTYQLYQLQNEAQLTMQQLRPREGSGTVSSDQVEKAQQKISDLNTRLETLLGPERAKAYRAQGNGSVFRTFTPRTAPSGATTGTAAPAVRLPGTGGG